MYYMYVYVLLAEHGGYRRRWRQVRATDMTQFFFIIVIVI